MKYEMFHVRNMQDTDILCGVANHVDRVVSYEIEHSVQNMVGYCRTRFCNILEKEGYIIVYRNLDFYVADNNIQ